MFFYIQFIFFIKTVPENSGRVGNFSMLPCSNKLRIPLFKILLECLFPFPPKASSIFFQSKNFDLIDFTTLSATTQKLTIASFVRYKSSSSSYLGFIEQYKIRFKTSELFYMYLVVIHVPLSYN